MHFIFSFNALVIKFVLGGESVYWSSPKCKMRILQANDVWNWTFVFRSEPIKRYASRNPITLVPFHPRRTLTLVAPLVAMATQLPWEQWEGCPRPRWWRWVWWRWCLWCTQRVLCNLVPELWSTSLHLSGWVSIQDSHHMYWMVIPQCHYHKMHWGAI